MEKITAEYLNEDNQILMTEEIYPCAIPRQGEVIYWHKTSFEVTSVEHHFEQRKIVLLVSQK